MSSHKSTNIDVCFYHRGCPDGIAAAWVIKRAHPDVTLSGLDAGAHPSGKINLKDKVVAFVDLCPNNKTKLLEVITQSKETWIIDHHKTSFETLEEIKTEGVGDKLKIVFDLARSGCQLAWDVTFSGEIRPQFIDYIGDRDLWVWKLEYSKEINTALNEGNSGKGYLTQEGLDELLVNWNKPGFLTNLIEEGANIITKQNEVIEVAVNSARIALFKDKYKVWLTTVDKSLCSNTGSVLANKLFSDGTKPAFAAIYLISDENGKDKIKTTKISMRGPDHPTEDTPCLATLAKENGGGGHKAAASFILLPDKNIDDYFTFFG